MIRRIALTIARPLALAMVVGSSAGAATFPADAAYVPLRCGGHAMTDPLGDDPAFPADRDLVGDLAAPAGLRAADAQFLYLRIRVDQDPAPGGVVRPYAWGMAFDLDGDRTTYELLITVDGIAASTGTVSVFTNHTTALADDPADLADLPAAATLTFADAARTVAAGTTTGGNPDFFVDIAVPWATLTPLGLGRGTRTYVWAGSSSTANALDGDLACHDAASGGAPRLDATGADPTTGDPAQDPGADGSLRLEGGGGCQAGGSLGIGCALALLGVLRRRRR